ncbi:MAG: hypothetical protein WD851_09260 [Pirellulales bacterium]
MIHRVHSSALLAVALGAIAMLSELANALPRTWIGGNVNWDDGGSTSNWTPADEPDLDDEAIFNTANTVNLGTNNSLQALTMSAGIDLITNDFDLTVDGLVQLADANTNLIVRGSASVVAADSVTINSGADLELDGGTISTVEETGNGLFEINAGGQLSGHGSVALLDGVAAGTVLMINDGTISASRAPLVLFGAPQVGTLSIDPFDSTDSELDLDGLSGNGIVNVFRNQTLDINVMLFDAFSGDLNLFHNSTFSLSSALTLDTGTIDVDNGFIDNGFPAPDVPAGVAFFDAALTQTGGTITVIDDDGTLQLDGVFTMNGGSLVNNGTVIFNANATIAAAASFTMPTSTSSLMVNAGVTVNVDQTNFNTDGLGTVTNVTTIEAGGILDIDLGAAADEGLSGTINLNGGELDVTTDDTDWALDGSGSVNVGASTGTSLINGERVVVSNPISVGANSTLEVNAPTTWEPGGSAVINSGALLTMDGLNTIFSGGGSFTGAGTLRTNSTSTVEANTTIAVNTFDWDGVGSGTGHTINDGVVFTINSAVFDTDGDMDDPIDIGGNGAQLIVSGPTQWIMEGILDANIAAAGTATIGGTSRMVLQSTMNVDGNTEITAPVTFGTGSTVSIDAGMTLDANPTATYSGGTIGGLGTFSPASSNTVTSNSTINATNFDFDNGSWTIDAGARLIVNVGDYDPGIVLNGFDTTITLNSGRISVDTGDARFVMNNVLNMNSTFGNFAIWEGEPLDIGNDTAVHDAKLNVAGSGVAQIGVPVYFHSDADVEVANGATLQFLTAATVNFDTVNGANNAQFTGGGLISFSGQVNVNEAVTLDMVGGIVSLDGLDGVGELINIDAPLMINADTVTSFGRNNGGGGVNTLDIDNNVGTGSLSVNLPTDAEWTLNAPGVMNLVNDNAPATLLAGSEINLNGTVNVSGDVRTTARVDIGSTGVVNVNTAAEPLRLAGGNNTFAPNLIAGGAINGPGLLGADTGAALSGFGTINASIDFDGDSELIASGGLLDVNATITDVGRLRVVGPGVLDLALALNTSVTDNGIRMVGGTIQGAAITTQNLKGITGFGIVSNRIFNEGTIQAAGGILEVETAANDNDWDGATNAGRLLAHGPGSLLDLRDNALFNFAGTVQGIQDGVVFTNGFQLDFSPGSTLLLSEATYRSNRQIHLGGALTVFAGANSLIDTEFLEVVDFLATSTTTLDGNLELRANPSIVRSGATFSGGGSLIVLDGSSLILANTAVVDVFVENRGVLSIAVSGVGRADVRDYQQMATGSFDVRLDGPALNQFDRLVVSGAAQLAGTIDILLGAAVNVGDMFTIIAAPGGVSGMFSHIDQPAGLDPGEFFNVKYDPAFVHLVVVDAIPGDYNRNGVVDMADYTVWRDSLGASVADFAGADGDGNGLINQLDYNLWISQFGNTAPGAGTGAAVPEPASIFLLMAFVAVAASGRFKVRST